MGNQQRTSDRERVANSTALLYSDLLRQGETRIEFHGLDQSIPAEDDFRHSASLAERRDGKKFVITLSAPLTPDHPADPADVARYREDDATSDRKLRSNF